MSSDFAAAVFERVKKIPAGHVCTYGSVAKDAGRPGAARAVGRILSKNPYTEANGYKGDEVVPCHRVTNAKGVLTGHFGDTSIESLSVKRNLLTEEGVEFVGFDRVAPPCMSKHVDSAQ